MPNPLLPLFLPPAHTVCYAAGMVPHRGSAQLPTLDNLINRVQNSGVAWATIGGGTAAEYRPLQEHQWKSCDITYHASGCFDHQQASKLASELHAHFGKHTHKLATTRRANENKKNSHSQMGLPQHVPKYAPFLPFKCAHPQPLHLIGTIFAKQCSEGWHYKLPEHMLRIKFIKWENGWNRHVTPTTGTQINITNHFGAVGGQMWSLVVKSRVHAAAN
eukprot:1156506-Pelagomonas_calceolata.AAC.2